MMPRYLIEKLPEGLTSIVSGALPLDVVPPYGHGDYVISVISEETAAVLVPEAPQAPQNIAPPVVMGAPQIGQVLTAAPGQWDAADTITGHWRRDGTPIAGATGPTYTPTPADDLTTLSYVEEAVLAGLSATVQSSGVLIRYAPPTLAGTLIDEIFDAYIGVELVPTASAFTGENLTYSIPSLSGIGIDPATGVLSVNTDIAAGDRDVIVTAQNSGGAAQATLNVTIEGGVLVYTPFEGDVGDLWQARYRAPVTPADGLTYQDGKLIWPGTDGPNNGEFEMYSLSRVGDTYLSSLADGEITLRFVHTGTPGGVSLGIRASGGVGAEQLYWLRSELASGRDLRLYRTINGQHTVIGEAVGTTVAEGVDYTMKLRAEGSVFRARIWRTENPEPSTWQIAVTDSAIPEGGELGIVRAHARPSEILGMTIEPIGVMAPLRIANGPQFWTLTAPVGEPSEPIDFSEVIAGDVTQMTLSGPNVPAHSWNGKVLTVQASATLAPTDFTVSCQNGALGLVGGDAFINIEVTPAPATLTADTANLDALMRVEADRPYPVTDFSQHHSGGLWPYAYTVLAKPDWITVEHNGVAWGLAPGAPAAAAAITVRVSDARGDTVDLTTSVEVIAPRSRAGVPIPSGSDIPTFLDAAGAGPGDVYELEAGGSYTWINRGIVPAGTQADPIIVSGPASAVIDTTPAAGPFSGSPVGSFAGGLITEGFTIRAVSPTTNSGAAIGVANSNLGAHCYHYDHLVEGWRDDSVDPLNPPPGEIWEITDPAHPEAGFTHNGNCLSTTGRHIIFDGCTTQKMRTAFTNSIGQHEGGIFRHLCQQYRQDGGVSGRCNGLVIHQLTVGRPEGNYFDTEHQDLWQLFSEIFPPCRNIIWDNCFFSCESRDQNVQGIHCDHDSWAHDAILDYTNLTERPIIRDTVVLTSSQVGILHERFYEGVVDSCVILNHPDSSQTGTNIRMRAPSNIAVSDTICNSVGPARMEWRGVLNSKAGPGWSSIIAETNNEELSLTGEAIETIFPNWNLQGLAYEDPRRAVAAGQPASAARFWIDPAGAWSTAYPTIGPAWLRDGVA